MHFFHTIILFFMVAAGIFSSCSNKATDSSNQITTAPDELEQKVDSILALLTLEEKINMIHASSSFTSGGVPRLGIPELVMSDGPHGVRHEHGRDWMADTDADDASTYLPTGLSLASTWNTDLGYEFGKVLGAEANHRGKDIILGPGVNIFRTPLNGRNFEYLGEDPFLASRMAVGYIKGVQEQGVSACVKHYLANNQEYNRDHVDVRMSERALREIYLPAFAAAVQEAEVNSVMGAYNKFRGEHCCHNDYLVNKILKQELGFKGIYMSDWGAVHSTVEAVTKGCDLEMGTELSTGMFKAPDYSKFYMADTLLQLVKQGSISETLIDEKVRRILRVILKTNVIDKSRRKPGAFNTAAHQSTALKVAEESITLLKNNNALLPLNKDKIKTVAVIGANATRKQAGGGGSSQVKAKYEITPLEGIKRLLGDAAVVNFLPGYEVTRNGKFNKKLADEAVKVAKEADAVIFVGGLIHGYTDQWNDNAYDAEDKDKADMNLPFAQEELIQLLLKTNQNTVLVFIGGGPVDMSSFEPRSQAIIQAWYPGMEGGNALAKIIFGEVNPSGKLPVTFPKKLSDVPAHALGEYPGKDSIVHYKDDIFVGYRYYDTKNVEPLFPFGHGLSYTTFEFSNLKLERNKQTVTVKLNVTNTGTLAGSEVVQIYVKDEQAYVERPEKELKAFTKVKLNPGEIREVSFTLNKEAFQYYDEQKNEWMLEPGEFRILAGSSSRDIRLQEVIEL